MKTLSMRYSGLLLLLICLVADTDAQKSTGGSSGWVGADAVGGAGAVGGEAKTSDRKKSTLDSLVIIEVVTKDEQTSGSGFVAEMDGKKYLITNQHVIDCAESVSATALTGERIFPVSVDICASMDLIRMEITNDVPALSVAIGPLEIDDQITVYGNSAGGGVATKLNGKILGVGPDVIEVDAMFVEGNSGCPIMNRSGQVVGVASYATLYENPESWLSSDTRFQKIRRYGYRLDKATWKKVSLKTFVDQTKIISDAEQAIMTYAITYIAFRQYTKLSSPPIAPSPTRTEYYFTTEYGQRVMEMREVANPSYGVQYTLWQVQYRIWEEEYSLRRENVRFFRSGNPKSASFNSDVVEKKCSDYFKRAEEQFFSDILNTYQAQSGTLPICKTAIRNIQQLRDALLKVKFVSSYLQTKADELISACDFVLKLHKPN